MIRRLSGRTPLALTIVAILFGIAAALAAGFAALTPTSADAQGAVPGVGNGSVDWNGWKFTYDDPPLDNNADPLFDGLGISNVSYNGLHFLSRASLPVMNVYYQGACGPFADRLGGVFQTRPSWRTFVEDGANWLELSVEATIGAYVIYQSYYFSDDGRLDTHMFSKGLQCNFFHEHLPFFRFDFDVAGTFANDQIVRQTTVGPVVEQFEFNRSAASAVNHGWSVRDTVTGDEITINFDNGANQLPGGVIPETNYVNNLVFGRAYQGNEVSWGPLSGGLGPSRTVPWNNSEFIDGQDLVLWYTGYMPHSPIEGPDLWHSTGLRMTVQPKQCDGLPVTVNMANGQLPTSGNDVILGTEGPDVIAAGAGDDTICGLGGNDIIWGQDGADTIYGSDGDDKIRGGRGYDIIHGGAGADDLNGGTDDDEVYGQDGNDLFVRGGTGNDFVTGGDGDDPLVAGNGGEDIVRGGSGNDKVTGGPRPDVIEGGDGNDELRGHGGADTIFGQSGNDQLFGGKQPDFLDGGSGNDTCNGGITGNGAIESDSHVACEDLAQFP